MVRNPKYIKQHVITRFSDCDELDQPEQPEVPAIRLYDSEQQRAQGARRLFKMAEVRKRQIIEKVLMD
jgi:hypothetical protein